MPGALADRGVPAAGALRPGLRAFEGVEARRTDSSAAALGRFDGIEIEQDLEGLLRGLRALALELEAAFTAIAGNDLPEFEEVVARQELLCANLVRVYGRNLADGRVLRMSASADRGSGGTEDGMPADEVTAALLSLEELNRCYRALISHAGRSVQLLAALCGTYRGQGYDGMHSPHYLSRADTARLNQQTWDCEI